MASNPINTSTSTGFGGIDVQSIVTSLMQVAQQPIVKLKAQEADYQVKITSYANLLSTVSNFKDATSALTNPNIIGLNAIASDVSFITATAGSSATPGAYNISINNIASAQNIYSTRFGSQTSAVADLSTYGTQKIKIQTGNNAAQTITINSSNNTLSGIRDAINAAGAGVTASILKESGNFNIDSSNNTIIFNDGTANRTATIAAGSYTGAALATAVQSALNSATGTTNTFTVDYGVTAANKFTIKNSSGPSVTTYWGDAAQLSTAGQILGFSSASGALAAGSSVSGSNAVDSSYKLVLSANTTGAANRVSIQIDKNNDGIFGGPGETTASGLSVLAFNPAYNADGTVIAGAGVNMTQSLAGIDAKLKMNSIEVTRPTNQITDLVPGVTLNLLKGDPTTYATNNAQTVLTVSKDTGGLTTKLNSFVSAYNDLMKIIDTDLGNATTPGSLSGDSTIMGLQNSVYRAFNTSYNKIYLASMGLTRNKNGVLSLDTQAFSSFTTGNESNVSSAINTMATSLASSLNAYQTSILPARNNTYQKAVKDIQKKEDAITKQLDVTQQTLTGKYSALNNQLTLLQGVSTYLSVQMNTLIFGNTGWRPKG